LGTSLLVPDIEGLASDRPVDDRRHLVSAWMEVAVDECVSGEESLCLIRRFEALHL
jgi:hypothetical protein